MNREQMLPHQGSVHPKGARGKPMQHSKCPAREMRCSMHRVRGYKTELDLTNKQRTACLKHAGCARFAYNWGIARKQEAYRAGKQFPTAMELHRELNALKQTAYPWMYEVSKCAPQEALRDLDKSYKHFFRRLRLKKEGKYNGPLGFPRFRAKKKERGHFRLTGNIHMSAQTIQLPCIGSLRLREQGYLPTSEIKILSATISEQAGRWFVSVQVEEEVPTPSKACGEPIGVDLGIKFLAVCSDGRAPIPNPKALRTHLKKLRRFQRRLCRRTKGGKNWEKARQLLARQHYRIANIRCNALHQATSSLTHAHFSKAERESLRSHLVSTLPEPKTKVEAKMRRKQVKQQLHQANETNTLRRPRVIVMEDLYVTGLLKNHKLARAIADVGMGEFRRQMTYKATWNGESLLLADRFYPSTKKCSHCGHVKAEISLSERSYECSECGMVIDRDDNSALNLVALAPKPLLSTASSAGIDACREDVRPGFPGDPRRSRNRTRFGERFRANPAEIYEKKKNENSA
jgi:putative transposase